MGTYAIYYDTLPAGSGQHPIVKNINISVVKYMNIQTI